MVDNGNFTGRLKTVFETIVSFLNGSFLVWRKPSRPIDTDKSL